jgi:chromosome partitioning protein
MEVIAVANQKGGCGKTTTTVNLAAYLALRGSHVLLIDLDPQGSSTTHLGIDKDDLPKNMNEVMMERAKLEDIIIPTTVKGLDIAPTNNDLVEADAVLTSKVGREKRLRKKVQALGGYDFVIIDTPPALGNMTLNALVACDKVIVPIQVEFFAVEGLKTLIRMLDELDELGYQPNRRYLLTMCDNRRKITEEVSTKIRNLLGDAVYKVVIPENVRLVEAPSQGQPICLYDPSCSGALGYKDLADEVAA